jgi:hypothetical protein
MTQPHFYIFVIISPFEENLTLYLNKLEFPSPKDNWPKCSIRICSSGVMILIRNPNPKPKTNSNPKPNPNPKPNQITPFEK